MRDHVVHYSDSVTGRQRVDDVSMRIYNIYQALGATPNNRYDIRNGMLSGAGEILNGLRETMRIPDDSHDSFERRRIWRCARSGCTGTNDVSRRLTEMCL